jgi:hypothetical protein
MRVMNTAGGSISPERILAAMKFSLPPLTLMALAAASGAILAALFG